MVNWQDEPMDPDLDIGDLRHIIESLETEIRYVEEMVAALPDLRAKLLVANRELDKRIADEMRRFDRGEMAEVGQVEA